MYHWLQNVSEKMTQEVPELGTRTPRLPKMLSAGLAGLLIARLPRRISEKILALLPSDDHTFEKHLSETGDRSIGYPEFLEKTFYVCPWDISEELAGKVTASFLENVLNDLPVDLQEEIGSHLPTELLVRMNFMRENDRRFRKAV